MDIEECKTRVARIQSLGNDSEAVACERVMLYRDVLLAVASGQVVGTVAVYLAQRALDAEMA